MIMCKKTIKHVSVKFTVRRTFNTHLYLIYNLYDGRRVSLKITSIIYYLRF